MAGILALLSEDYRLPFTTDNEKVRWSFFVSRPNGAEVRNGVDLTLASQSNPLTDVKSRC